MVPYNMDKNGLTRNSDDWNLKFRKLFLLIPILFITLMLNGCVGWFMPRDSIYHPLNAGKVFQHNWNAAANAKFPEENNKICKKCGKVTPNAKYCPQCGSPIGTN